MKRRASGGAGFFQERSQDDGEPDTIEERRERGLVVSQLHGPVTGRTAQETAEDRTEQGAEREVQEIDDPRGRAAARKDPRAWCPWDPLSCYFGFTAYGFPPSAFEMSAIAFCAFTLSPALSSGGEITAIPNFPGETAMIPPPTPLFAGSPVW